MFVPNYQIVGDAAAPHLAFVLHGILGSGQNFRSFARELQHRFGWFKFALVDLRCHGASLAAPAPHTVESAARDLYALADAIGQHPKVLIGHSFGGKVGLEYLRQSEGSRGRALEGAQALEQLWLLDSNPGSQEVDPENEVVRVLSALRAVPEPIVRRPDAVKALAAQGLSSGLANWLGTSLKWERDRFVWTLDFAGIDALLEDYFRLDLWGVLERERTRPQIHFVVAEHSDRFAPGVRQRAFALGPRNGVYPHLLRDSGHWVHVDNPSGLLGLFEASFPQD